MSETLTTYRVDSTPVADLPSRYGIGRTQFYEQHDRFELPARGRLGLKFESRGNRAYQERRRTATITVLRLVVWGIGGRLEGLLRRYRKGRKPSISEQRS